MFKARKYNKLMNNIGTVNVYKSYVTVDVDNDILRRMLSISENKLIIKSNYLKHKYNRPITYNINDMNFENVSVYTDEGVCFKNCNFIDGINIVKGNFLLFSNNNYISQKDEYDDNFFVAKDVDKLLFYQENVTDQNVAFRIDSESVQLFESVLLEDNGHTNIKCDSFNMDRSRIGGETSFKKKKKMFLSKESVINNKKNCMIQCPNIIGEKNFDSPRLIINGTLYTKEKEKQKDLN